MTSAVASYVRFRFDRKALMRLVVPGSAWGLTLAFGFFAIGYAQCGALPCLDDAAVTTLTCIGAGCISIGPLAAFAPPR